MTTERRKRLIEVAFPLEEVSAHSRREKNVRHGYISTLHAWWARRPLAACRAFIYASLVDDPDSDAERESLLREVADLASWDAVRHPERVIRTDDEGGSGLDGTQLLERARRRILKCNGGLPPKLLDPFAGGGAIPLEALRLGIEAEASDLNPVAALVLKGTIEYPQKYGQPDSRTVPNYIRATADRGNQMRFTEGDLVEAYRHNPLTTDVKYWGLWMLERAREELDQFYPLDPDGNVPVAYLWSRVIPCPNCGGQMPLIRQFWLARKDNKRVALEPELDLDNHRVDFKVVEGPDVTGNPALATTSRGDAKCLLCEQVVEVENVRKAGVDGKMGAILTSVVTEGSDKTGKKYRADQPVDNRVFESAAKRLNEIRDSNSSDLAISPDEPVPYDPQNLKVRTYGMMTWQELFNDRQLLALTTFARLVGEAHGEMLRNGLEPDYAAAIATYLGFAVDRLSDFNSTLCVLKSAGARGITHTFARQALPIVWDYAESNPFAPRGAGWRNYIEYIVASIESFPIDHQAGLVTQRDARVPSRSSPKLIITDPPYYDAINYSNLSDFFYVWLKRSIGFLHPDLFSLPLTPKRDEIIVNVYETNGAD